MINIPAPIGDHFAEFQDLVDRKSPGQDRTTLVAMAATIETRFGVYSINKLKPEDVPVVSRTQGQKDSLKSCYENSTKFKKDITGVDEEGHKLTPRCPYCQINPASTLDHFLPASKFPDFYVYRPNVIHVCSICNEAKGNRFVVPTRRTVNPYFDNLSEVPYLRCSIDGGDELTANFSIDPDTTNPNYDAYVAEVVTQHFEKYGLARKFRTEASRKISDFRRDVMDWQDLAGDPPDQVVLDRILDRRILSVCNNGPNHWELAFWEGMKEFPDLLVTVQRWYAAPN